MRIIYPNIKNAKKSAKAIKSVLQNVTLSTVQNTLAKVSGYRNWHDLEQHQKENHGIQMSTPEEEKQLALMLSLRLSEQLNIDWQTAIYAISEAHIVGANLNNINTYESIWLEVLQKKYIFSKQRHSAGSIIKLKIAGRMGEPCYLSNYGQPTNLISHASTNTSIADFEITVPRQPLPLFIPSRLKFAYGYWIESDGNQVLFSRDYIPLWRIQKNKRPERLDPWIRIKKVETHFFWDGKISPWYNQDRRDEENTRLKQFGINSLPKLVDFLPELIFNPEIKTVDNAIDALANSKSPKHKILGSTESKQKEEINWIELIGGGFAHDTAPFAVHPNDEKRAKEYLHKAENENMRMVHVMYHAHMYLSGVLGGAIGFDKQMKRVREYYTGRLIR